nr:MAG TPA: tail protein [Caudoviricetes sp.]
MRNFLRTYSITCGVKGGAGFEIGDASSKNGNVLHISFSVEKSNSETPNNGKVQIWNLSPESLKVLDTKDCILELKAGYGNNRSIILVGSVVSAITTLDNADRLTEVEVVDGKVALSDTVVSISKNGTVGTKDLYQEIADAMGVSVIYADYLQFPDIPNGFTFVGTAKNALHKITGAAGHTFSIQNGVLQITVPSKPIQSSVYVLSAESGLLGIPKRITLGDKGKDPKTGYEIEYLLNGAVGINDIVRIETKALTGEFLVIKVTYDGDNMEGDWKCTAQVIAIQQA